MERRIFEAKMEEVEVPMMKLSGMPDGAIQRHWASFTFDGQDFRARYFIIGEESKPTLLMTLGAGACALQAVLTFKGLAENFRVIAYDGFSYGANTRLDYCSGHESFEKAKACLLEWYTKFIASIDHILPRKFFMLASCGGSYPNGLWVAKNQERIEKLFFWAPAGI